MNFADDLVVDDPLEFCTKKKGEFSVNVFGFGSHSCFLFHQVWWSGLRRGFLSLFVVPLDLSYFIWFICIGVRIIHI